MLGLIFKKAQNQFRDPAKVRRLIVELIGQMEEILTDPEERPERIE